jgi:hypothetical protein
MTRSRNPKEQSSPLLALLEPPPHVSRRCGAHARSTGEPCRKWAVRGRTRCRNHGGVGGGRPPTHGRRTARAERSRLLLQVAKALLAQHYEVPAPLEVEAPPHPATRQLVQQPLVERAPTDKEDTEPSQH